MSLVPVKYPLDLTGAASSNHVQEDPYSLPSTNIRVLVPRYGAFYTKSVVLKDAISNRTLVYGKDYYAGLLYTQATEQSGQEVHQILVITDATCGTKVLFDAQMVGGEFSYSFDAIIQLINQLNLDNRPIAYANIIGLPDGFPPAPHLHSIGDTYGWEYVIGAMDRISQAILLGSSAGTNGIYNYVDAQIGQVNTVIALLQQSRSSPKAITTALGYTPLNAAGGKVSGPLELAGPTHYTAGKFTKTKSYVVTTSDTPIDLSLTDRFIVALNLSTSVRFDISKMTNLGGDDCIEFTLLVKNDGTANRLLTFSQAIQWQNKTQPARTTAANAVDEYKFITYDGGVTWIGSLRPNIG